MCRAYASRAGFLTLHDPHATRINDYRLYSRRLRIECFGACDDVGSGSVATHRILQQIIFWEKVVQVPIVRVECPFFKPIFCSFIPDYGAEESQLILAQRGV